MAARIVWADDSESDRFLIEEACREAGLAGVARLVRDGREALQALRESLPRLVVLDLDMPTLDGLGTLRAIRTDRELRHLPVVLFSGRPAPPGECESLGIAQYLRKPADWPSFSACVERIVRLAPVEVPA